MPETYHEFPGHTYMPDGNGKRVVPILVPDPKPSLMPTKRNGGPRRLPALARLGPSSSRPATGRRP